MAIDYPRHQEGAEGFGPGGEDPATVRGRYTGVKNVLPGSGASGAVVWF